MRLSPHFDLSEFTRSDTARVMKIDNVPNLQEIENLTNYKMIKQQLLKKIKKKKVRVTKG